MWLKMSLSNNKYHASTFKYYIDVFKFIEARITVEEVSKEATKAKSTRQKNNTYQHQNRNCDNLSHNTTATRESTQNRNDSTI